LDTCDEENDSAELSQRGHEKNVIISIHHQRILTHHVDEEPMFRVHGVLIEEKGSTDETLSEKVGCESRKPFENMEACSRFEHEQSNRLLHEQAGYDGGPLDVRPVLRRRPKAKLEHEQTEYGDRSITITRALYPKIRISKWITQIAPRNEDRLKVETTTYIFGLETEHGAQDNREEREPPQAVADVPRKGEEGSLDNGNPDGLDGTRDDRVGDEPESDDGDEQPGEKSLHDPPVARRGEQGGRDPPSEDERGESKEPHAADEAAVPHEPRRLVVVVVLANVTMVDDVRLCIIATRSGAFLFVWKRGCEIRGLLFGKTALLY